MSNYNHTSPFVSLYASFNDDPLFGGIVLFSIIAIIALTVLIIMTLQPQNDSTTPNLNQNTKNKTAKPWPKRLHVGMAKTRARISETLSELFDGTSIDDDLLEKIHETLYRADIGVKTCDRLVAAIKQNSQSSTPSWDESRAILKQEISEIMNINARAWSEIPKPRTTLVVGVNGVGKTTTIGKLAFNLLKNQETVMLCAADTFRAAAIEQLSIWADRLKINIVKHNQGSDPAAVAFDAIRAAKSRNIDNLIIDTAGRLHNKSELMAELAKIKKVSQKELPSEHYQTLLVIDATTGQNAAQQVKTFNQIIELDGIIVTKLDGTAKGGALVGIVDQYKIPIFYLGVGESLEDLRPFSSKEFADSIL